MATAATGEDCNAFASKANLDEVGLDESERLALAKLRNRDLEADENDSSQCTNNLLDSESQEEDEARQSSPEFLQRKLYFLLGELKKMHAQLPESFQIRITYELLTELANSLLNDTIFEIVKGLMEIQHVTERHLLNLREQVESEYEQEVQTWTSKLNDVEELEHMLNLLKIKHSKRIRETDQKIIALLDQKVKDQQSTLNKAGVTGFYETDVPREITIQMFLLDFILRLSRMKFEP